MAKNIENWLTKAEAAAITAYPCARLSGYADGIV